MKKKLLFVLFATLVVVMLAFSVSAATTVTPTADALGDCVINGEVVSGDTLPITQGMSYTVLDEEAKTVALSSRGSADSFTGAVVIPSTITIDGVEYKVTTTNPGVFTGTSITKIYVPDTVVEMLGYATGSDNGTFANCKYLSEVYIGTGIKTIGRFVFTSIGRSSAVKVFYVAGKVQVIGEYAFNAANFADDCEITFDSSELRRIESYAFLNNAKAMKVFDSEHLEYIGEKAFNGYASLEYLLVPEYCTMGNYVMNGATGLKTLIIRSADDEIKAIPKEMLSSGGAGSTINIYIKGMVEAKEWAVLPGRAFNIYMDSYATAKYFADSMMNYGYYDRMIYGQWYFCEPHNGAYHFTSDSKFNLTAKSDVTEPQHIVINFKNVVSPATCSRYEGFGDLCEVCGVPVSYTQTGTEYDLNAHAYRLTADVLPTCTVTGLKTYTCSYCQDTYSDVVPVLGHAYTGTSYAPTCTLEGYTNNVCNRCDYSIVTNRVDTIPHSYLGTGISVDGLNVSYSTKCKYCGAEGDKVEETLVNKCYIEGYGIFDATLEYLSISPDGVVTPSSASFDNAVIYFPSYVEIDGSIVEVKTIQGFKSLSIKGVYIPDTVTRIVGGTNGQGCFQYVYDLKNIVVGKGITELESYVFNMYGKNVVVDEFIFTNTITKMGSGCIGRIFQASSDIPYQFKAVLVYAGSLISVGDRTGGNILREVYVTNECDLSEKFAFNGSNGLKRAYIEGGKTEAEAKELTQEMFSGDALGLEILIKGYVKATGQAVLPTKGALLFFQTLDQAKVFAATVRAQAYYERGSSSAWYICESTEANRYLINNYSTAASEITFKTQSGYTRYHAGLTVTTESTCTQGGIVTGTCYMCGVTLDSTVAEPTPHRYDGGVFATNPICCVMGEVKYTCLDCGEEKYVATGYDPSAHQLDTIVTILFKLGYNEKGTYVYECSACHEILEEEAPTLSPLFTCLGYSAPESGKGGIAIGYTVNNEVVAEYVKATGKTLKYGVFAVSQKKLGNNDVFGKDGTVANGVINADLSNQKFSAFELKITGFTDDNKDTKLAMGAYVAVTDGEGTEYSYLQSGTPNEGEKYYFASYNDIVG